VIEIQGERGPCKVVVESGSVARLREVLDREAVMCPDAVVTNTTVAQLHGRRAAAAVDAPPPAELPDGERFKRWREVDWLVNGWLDRGLHRGDSVMAVGGGVVTDTVGFAAAVYLRGISWVAVPTTLLAMVDAAVGGKTGINLARGKNLVGAFWAPQLVVADPHTLRTLPQRELRAGLAEVVKAAWLGDRGLLDLVAGAEAPDEGEHRNRWMEIVSRAVAVKASVVEADEREAGSRRALNLGHTLGHGVEAVTGYRRFLHGEAVAWGLRGVARIAVGRTLLSRDAAARLEGAIRHLEPLPTLADLDPDEVLQHVARDKKRDDLGVGWVLPTDDGVVLDQRVTADELRAVFLDLQRTG
jgi:3-dehydroquinate synthase